MRAFARSATRAAVPYFDQALVALGHLPRTAVATDWLSICGSTSATP